MILMDDIIKEWYPTLNKVAKDVPLPLTISDKKLLKDMMEYVRNSQNQELATKYDLRPAVGISAPQLNISKRLFVIYVEDFNGVLYDYMLINPKLTILNEDKIYLPGGEGCLSVDRETTGITPRFNNVLIEAHRFDDKANIVVPIELRVSGYIGIVFQHEYDHLEGILFTEKMYPEIENAKPAFEIVSED